MCDHNNNPGYWQQGLEILAKRAYPELKKSGMCSRHRENGHFECEICYPVWDELLKAHMEVSHRLYDELLALSGLTDPPNGRIGTNAIVAELKRKLKMEEVRSSPVTCIRKPNTPKDDIKHVLDRMWNWKMDSAFRVASAIENFPPEALAKLNYLKDEFGNCGWQDGEAYGKLRDANNEVAELLGYTWSDDQDKWILKPS